jgi:hypothetical protein
MTFIFQVIIRLCNTGFGQERKTTIGMLNKKRFITGIEVLTKAGYRLGK